MGRHSRPDGQHQRAHSPHLVPVPSPGEGRHRARSESSSRSGYEGRHHPGYPGRTHEGRTHEGRTHDGRGYEGRHDAGDGSGYEGRHRARHAAEPAGHPGWATESYQSARRAVVATTVATTLTAGGVVALLLNHTAATAGGPDQQAAVSQPHRQEATVTWLADDRSALPGRTIRSAPAEGRTPAQGSAPTKGSAPAQATGRARGTATPRAGTTRRATSKTAQPTGRARSAAGTSTRSIATKVAARPAAKPAAAAPKWVRPGTGTISSCYCSRWGTFHWGVDLAAPYGAPIYAAGDGVVLRAGAVTGFGQAVYIQHANGDTTVYGHMEKILVTEGQHVHAGQEIALVGAEGEATGPHLHFEVHQGSEYGPKINPGPWLAARGVNL